MNIALIVAREVAVMLLILLLGIFLRRKAVLTIEFGQQAAAFLVIYVMPIIMLNTFNRERISHMMPSIWLTIGFSFFVFAVSIAFSMLVFRNRENNYKISRIAMILPNCGFMGIPLLRAATGENSVLLCAAVFGTFQLSIWCWAIPMLNDRKPRTKDVFANPGTLTFVVALIMYMKGTVLPAALSSFLAQISSVNTPLSMLVAGVFLADLSPKQVLKAGAIKAVLLRNIAIPLVVVLLIWRFGWHISFGYVFAMAFTIVFSCPTAISAILLPARIGEDGSYASCIVALSATVSMFTLPVVVFVAEALFNR